MEYSKLVAVTGLPGLYELINSKTDGAIVRSLDDKSTRFVSNRIHQFSHLESIEVYTTGDNVNLVDVLLAMDKASEKPPEEKDPASIKKYFEKVFPDLDFDRVYTSDMKKMVKWLDTLKKNDIEIKLSEIPEEEEEEAIEEVAKEKKPAKKTKTADKETAEDKPAKKTASKPAEKKPAGKEESPKKKSPPKKK
jgi:chemotaxis regulatin CheY-phosphate phosphatase CheZ